VQIGGQSSHSMDLSSWLTPPGMSHYAENLLEHVFISEVLQECAFVRHQTVGVLHAEVDDEGYDLVFELGEIVRHVQLKSRLQKGATKRIKVNANLERHTGGCVVLMSWEVTPHGRASLHYRWFGGAPTEPTKRLPNRDTDKPRFPVLRLGDFDRLDSISDLVSRLFGPPPSATDELLRI
jgi:hypothetical protein